MANSKHNCPLCPSVFKYRKSLYRHIRKHRNHKFSCSMCEKTFERNDNLLLHLRSCLYRHGKPVQSKLKYTGGYIEDTISKFSQNVSSTKQNNRNILNILHSIILNTQQKLKQELKRMKALKFYISTYLEFQLSHDPSYKTNPPVVMNSPPKPILESSDIPKKLEKVFRLLTTLIDEFQENGSGFILTKIHKMDLFVMHYKPLRGGHLIHTLPKYLIQSKSIANVICQDGKCFLYCIIKSLFLKSVSADIKYFRQYIPFLKTEGFTFPMKISDIEKFSSINGLSISIFGFENEFDKPYIYPILVSKNVFSRPIDLLLLEDKHYCLIEQFDKLASLQYTSSNHKSFFCRSCLHGCSSETHKISHQKDCFKLKSQRTIFPTDPVLKFENTSKRLKEYFCVYADMESLLVKKDDPNVEQIHEICSYAYQIVTDLPDMKIQPRLYVGKNANSHFLDQLSIDYEDIIRPAISKSYPLRWDLPAAQKFYSSNICNVCNEPLHWGLEAIVRDHCHLTHPKYGNMRGAIHSICNLNLRFYPKRHILPVIFHAGSSYDFHHIINGIRPHHGRLSVIANSSTNYITLSVGKFKFLDSLKFLKMSLDKVAKSVSVENFHYINAYFKQNAPLVQRKGYFFYEYLDSWEKFDEQELPPIGAFFNKMTGKSIRKRDYRHAKSVWDVFQCKNIREYHNVYLLSDTLILSDVFEYFRKRTLETYRLDPLKYPTLPSLAYDCMLSHTKVKLERLTDVDMFHMIEANLRGGISTINHRFAEANRPELPTFNPEKPISTIIYLDVNSLYSHCMTKYLPVDGFKWEPTVPHDILTIPENSTKGYILEVTLKYPIGIHNQTNTYPLCPEHLLIEQKHLSPFQKEFWPKMTKGERKLCPNMFDKVKYVCHYQSLQLWVNLGMEIVQFHRIISFNQSPFLKDFTEYNMKKRQEAVLNGDTFGKVFYKFWSNSLWGKFAENSRFRKAFELITSKNILLKRTAKPNFKELHLFHDNLVGVSMIPTKCVLSKCLIVGFTILEYSKIVMYDFHYKKWLPKFPSTKVIMSDTDSMLYYVEEDVYPKLHEMEQYFDFSNYDPDNALYSDKNTCQHGLMKDETCGELILQTTGLRPKLYNFSYIKRAHFDYGSDNELEEVEKATRTSFMKRVLVHKNTMRGVPSQTSEQFSPHMFKQCLFSLGEKYSQLYRIGQKKHNLFTFRETKLCLSAFDNKRYLLDEVNTLAHGHYKTMTNSSSS